MLRGELRDLDRELAAASEKAADRETRLHIEGARAQLREMLEPKETYCENDKRPPAGPTLHPAGGLCAFECK
jgi:hypothetical protein